MDVLVPIGKRFGDESAGFVALCDAFIVLGGGAQSEAECRRASEVGKPITVIQGFGGVADGLVVVNLLGVRIVAGR